jgi:hypothetical protein
MFEALGWSLATAATWGITVYRASLALTRSRRAADEEIEYWQGEATRARELVAQLKHERAVWSSGCRQGREDVIAIMPLLVAAQQKSASAPAFDYSEAIES